MSLKQRIRALESHPVLQTMGPKIDPIIEYIVTGQDFDTLCKNLNIFYRPLTGQGALLRLYFGERDVDQDTKKPFSDNISAWHRIVLEHILQYSHKVAFDLANFDLQHWEAQFRECKHIKYGKIHVA